jgi:hypothetical protein
LNAAIRLRSHGDKTFNEMNEWSGRSQFQPWMLFHELQDGPHRLEVSLLLLELLSQFFEFTLHIGGFRGLAQAIFQTECSHRQRPLVMS